MSTLSVVMTAAHGGYDSDKIPLGGGAAVCERLCAAWGSRSDVQLTLLGSGPQAPAGVRYRAFPARGSAVPSSLDEFAYARFCRDFEKATVDYILRLPERPVVISHDISEGPSFGRLARAGVPCLTIFHVDAVEYFSRFYLGDVWPASWWTGLHRRWRSWLPVPDLLQLVFEKQLQAVEHCPYVIVSSPPMKEVLHHCYSHLPKGRVQVMPWGSPLQQPPAAEVSLARRALVSEWSLDSKPPLLLTMSRISPEKNQALLLEALRLGETLGQVPRGLTLVIAGDAAFMRGQQYFEKLRGLAGRLQGTRVIFAGHLGGARKRAALEMADLFIVPSSHESYGLTLLEALAAGLPAVGVDSYGTRATLGGRPECGVLTPARDPRGLWAAILDLLRSPQERARLRRGALQRATEESFAQASDRLLDLARRVSPGPALPPPSRCLAKMCPQCR